MLKFEKFSGIIFTELIIHHYHFGLFSILTKQQSCKQFGSKKTFNDNVRDNELLSLYEKTYQAVYYKKRIAKTKKDIKQVDMLLKQLKTSRNDYRTNKISEDDFRNFLKEFS